MTERSREELFQQIGRLQGQVEGLARDIARHCEASERLEEKVDRLKSTIDQAKGGWKALSGAAVIGGAVGGFLVKGLAFLKGG
jgi:predicted nuclease with TOPRIM domain